MKNLITLFGLVFFSSLLFTNCTTDDGTIIDDDPTDLPCANYSKKLLTLTTEFDGNPNATIDYNSFIINNLNPSLPNPEGSFATTTDLTYELPTSSSIFNESNNLHGILVTRAGKYFTFDTSSATGQEFTTPTNIASPVLSGTNGYVIEVSNAGYATSGIADHFDIKTFNINNGTVGTSLPIATINTTFDNNSFFNVESMSAATNAGDELYFLSGTNLITVNTATNIASHIDLYPSFSMVDFVRFIGLEYSESLGLIAIIDIPNNNIQKLVKIDLSSGTYSDLLTIPSNINTEFYSSTYSECNETYYLTSMINGSNPTKTRYFEFDLATNTVSNTQSFDDYVFGVELIP